ncbi:hypothetical protein PTD2_20957 [Pseudoalteromonas tunicata D2]|uniref:Uncharacterized protein n=1 Tax=Pseudoalteromonas tunicata D2 TaxID=87626 RepID=A4CAB7_9GAMM|nr:hypothetical protein PTD2_20957 [Pseudoalteromonas tunicata D2]
MQDTKPDATLFFFNSMLRDAVMGEATKA